MEEHYIKWNYNYTDIVIDDISSFPENCIGFIYEIQYTDGTKYIGKKNLFITIKKERLKTKQRENAKVVRKRKNGHIIEFDLITEESNWKRYKGSSLLTRGKKILRKDILFFVQTKLELAYLEVKTLMQYNVLEKKEYLNENILGKFYKGRFDKLEQYNKEYRNGSKN